MSAEGKPHDEVSLLALPLTWGASFALRFPKFTLVVAVALAAVSVWAGVTQLGMRSSRADLLNPNDRYAKLFSAYTTEFGDYDDAVIVVRGSDAAYVRPILDELAAQLAQQADLFGQVLCRVDFSRVRAKGLQLASESDLAQAESFAAHIEPFLRAGGDPLKIAQLSALAASAPNANAAGNAAPASDSPMSTFLAGLHAAVVRNEPYRSPWPSQAGALAELGDVQGQRYLTADEGRLGFILLHLLGEDGQLARGSTAVDRAREILANVQRRHPEAELGLTGLPVLENDEMRVSQYDMNVANFISLAAVGLLFYAGFGGMRHALLGVVALLLGMAWSFGFAAVAVGHLNILSVAFGVVLIGLGIDFPIHLVACYLDERRTQADVKTAIANAVRGTGPGIVTGGLTTALAFFTVALTNFRGVAELGIISGGGIILCLTTALVVLPALLLLSDRNRPPRELPSLRMADAWQRIFADNRLTLPVVFGLSALCLGGFFWLKYDSNLLHLQAPSLPSVAWERRLLSETDQGAWHAISLGRDAAELRTRKQQFLAQPSVIRVEEIVSLLPATDADKLNRIQALRTHLDRLAGMAPRLASPVPEALAGELGFLQGALFKGDASFRAQREQLDDIRQTLAALPPATAAERLAAFQAAAAHDVFGRVQGLRALADARPLELADVPENLRSRFLGTGGTFALRVYGRGNIWDPAALASFVTDVQAIDPAITGHPLQAHFAGQQLRESYVHSGIYAALVVAIVVMLDFRSIRYSLLSMLPLALGMVQLFGLLGWLGVPLNPANLIALPLVIGIGIDSGVHFVHDFRRQTGPYRLSHATLNSVMLSALTTTGSFGALLFAQHQGLRTLGQVLTLGVTSCFLNAAIVLPAVFAWLERRRNRAAEVIANPHRMHARRRRVKMTG